MSIIYNEQIQGILERETGLILDVRSDRTTNERIFCVRVGAIHVLAVRESELCEPHDIVRFLPSHLRKETESPTINARYALLYFLQEGGRAQLVQCLRTSSPEEELSLWKGIAEANTEIGSQTIDTVITEAKWARAIFSLSDITIARLQQCIENH
jgi:hypothetical protein